MSGYFAAQDRRQRLALLAILAFGSWMLWQTWLGNLLLYPFTILSTWFHEMGHGLAAMLLGNRFEQLLIYPDGSGVALSLRPVDSSRLADALVAAGGPLGPPLAGAALIAASRGDRAVRIALAVLGAALLISTVIWVRTLTGWLVLPLLGAGILAIAWRASLETQRFAVQFLGVQACISTWRQTAYLFSQGGTIGGLPQQSDTQAIAQVLWLPYWFWGIAISAMIVAMLWWSFRYAFAR